MLLAQENCLAQALWYMDHMDLIAGVEHLSPLCQKLQHSSTEGCPKIAWHCTVGTPQRVAGDDQLQAPAVLATGTNVTTHQLPSKVHPPQAKPEK